MHDAFFKQPDDIALFVDHWVIVRKDGTPVLNGSPEEFENQLRKLIEGKK